MTYGGKEQAEGENELTSEHNHEINCCALQNSMHEARNAGKSPWCSPSCNENDREGKDVYDDETMRRG